MGRPPQEWVNTQIWVGQTQGRRREGTPRNLGKGDWRYGLGLSPSLPPSVMTQRHRIPISMPSPRPSPHRANMALQRGAQSSVELLQWLAWGLRPPKKSLFPFPAHPPFPESDSLPIRPGSVV